MILVLGTETVTFLEGRASLVVGTVSAAGDPHATRGWGVTVLDPRGGRLELLLDADDSTALAHLEGGGAIAVTATDVRTFESVQVKGRALTVRPATTADRHRARRYCDGFFGDIVETDGTPPELPERLVPTDYVRCVVVVEEVFDQTPGPGAGAPFVRARP